MNPTFTTQLSPREFAYVAGLGLYRLRSAEEKGRAPRGGIRQSDIGTRYAADIEGMCGEYVVAKLLGFVGRPEDFKPLVNKTDRDVWPRRQISDPAAKQVVLPFNGEHCIVECRVDERVEGIGLDGVLRIAHTSNIVWSMTPVQS